MYDLHTHSYASDGVLGPAELARRCQEQGYDGLALTDHCDPANIEEVVSRAITFCDAVRGQYGDMKMLPGCEITHVPPALIADVVARARQLGARIVLVHGETIVEPVKEGTNRAAIEAGVDALAHPGLITQEDAALAAEKGVMLEISGRQGHSLTNGHVAHIALEKGAKLSFGSDGHEPGDYPSRDMALKILRGANLSQKQAEAVLADTGSVFKKR